MFFLVFFAGETCLHNFFCTRRLCTEMIIEPRDLVRALFNVLYCKWRGSGKVDAQRGKVVHMYLESMREDSVGGLGGEDGVLHKDQQRTHVILPDNEG